MRKFLNYTISITYTGICITSSSLISLFIQACSNGSDATNTGTATPNATSNATSGTNGNLANVTGDVHVLVRAISAPTAMTTATATAASTASTPCGDMSTAGGFALVTVVLVVLGYPAVLTWFLLKKVRPRRFEVIDTLLRSLFLLLEYLYVLS